MHTHQELITLAGEGSLIIAWRFARRQQDHRLELDSNNDLHLLIWRAPSWDEIKAAEAQEKKGAANAMSPFAPEASGSVAHDGRPVLGSVF